MTEIKIKKIVKMSSQDSVFKAENLLRGSAAHGEEDTKWIGAKDEETKQFVVLELEKAAEIHQVSVENESSAFVEIRVGGKSAEDHDDDFEVLLSAVSLMTPSESKSRLNANRLKAFTSEKELDKEIARKKSQRVLVICTQPFNTKIQFGLSSIKFFDQILDTPGLSQIKTGTFSLKKETASDQNNQSSDINAGSLFKKARERKEEETSQEPSTSKGTPAPAPTPASKPEYFLDFKSKASAIESDDDEKENKKVPLNGGNAKVKEQKQPEKKTPEPAKIAGPIFKGIVFALSGFQNPLRSELRDKALKLGAKYRPDWTDECTHLICAFSNTPKAAQVRQTGGKIVTKEWLFSCEKAKKLLDEEDFELAKLQTESSEDDDENTSRPRKAAKAATKKISKLKKRDELDDSYEEEEAENSDDRDFIVDSSEIEMEEDNSDASSLSEGESSDSDDSTERATSRKREKKKAKSNKKAAKKPKSDEEEEKAEKKSSKKTKKAESSSSSSSDSDAANSKTSRAKSKNKKDEDLEEWELPTFFDDKQFFIYGDFDQKELRNIKRQLVAFGGNLNDYMSEDIDYVITDKDWDESFGKAKEENKKLVIVNQDWLEACTRRKKLVAHQPYEVKDD